MDAQQISEEFRRWIVAQATAGQPPETVLKPLLDAGWQKQQAIDLVEEVMRGHLAEHARANGLPVPLRVPSPAEPNGAALLEAGDCQVRVLTSVMLPRVVVLGGLLSEDECDEMIEMARPRLRRSTTVDPGTGGDIVHEARTSEGMFFNRGENPLCQRIEARIAALLEWPLENGEGLQVLRYGVGAEYKPHYDYFDPEQPGSEVVLRRGGQRVASVVMYLNTPECGGATIFPDVHLEVGAVKGNAVFFSYDRPHPMTRTLHGGAPVRAGEKWVATKWLREGRHD